MEEVGKPDSQGTPGNRGFMILSRQAGDRAEILTLSLWETLEAIRGFAGEDIGRAVFYPDDDPFLVERDIHVDHWQVAEGSVIDGLEARRA